MSNTNSQSLDTPPYIFVVTPLIIFILVGVLATIMQMRRRNRLRAMGYWPPPEPYFGTNPPGRSRPEATAWIPVVVRGVGARGGGGRTARNPNGSTLAPRQEEGLNELGEAPPPYDPKSKEVVFKDVELGSAAADPPGYGAVAATSTGERSLGSNNPYVTDERGEGSIIRPPPPVVTR